jgi:hypothetical protein
MLSFLLSLAVCAGLPLRASGSELHAMAIGFNDYENVQRLLGAENDAADIAAVLRGRGVTDVETMTGGRTMIADFKTAFAAMAARAVPGDLLLISFSGHGIRVPETRMPRRTPDGYDKGFLFPTYDRDRHPDELLRDEDLYDLFKQTAAKGLHILFIVDACHAGTGIRGGPASAPLRFQRWDLKPGDPPVVPPLVAPPPRPPIPFVMTMTAQVAELAITEINVDGSMRGALSYAVARGLEGGADAARTGSLTVGMLWDYVRPIVRARAESQQAPDLFARDTDSAMPILVRAPRKTGDPHPGLPDLKPVSLFVRDGAALRLSEGASLANDKAKAELIFDAPRRQILNGVGDVLASDIDGARLDGAIQARRLLTAFMDLADREGGLNVSLHSGNGVYVKGGAPISVRVDRDPYNFLTLLDLTADGEIRLIYPQGTDPLETKSTSPISDVRVTPPYGADYLVAIRSEKPLSAVHAAFRGKSYAMPAGGSYALLRQGLAGTALRVGIQGIYTCERLTEAGRCISMAVP